MKKKYKKKIITIIVLVASISALFFFWDNIFTKNPGMTRPDEIIYTFDTNVIDKGIVKIVNTTAAYSNVGSGIVVAFDELYTYIITNAHVLDEIGSVEVSNGSFMAAATVVEFSRNTVLDIILLKITKTDYLVPVVISTNYKVADLVVTVGFPNGQYSVKAGLITAITEVRINSSARIDQGSSGSGLFSTEMKLVGLNKGMIVDGNGQWLSTLSIKSHDILSYLMGLGINASI